MFLNGGDALSGLGDAHVSGTRSMTHSLFSCRFYSFNGGVERNILTSGMRHPKYFLMSNRTFLNFFKKFVRLK